MLSRRSHLTLLGLWLTSVSRPTWAQASVEALFDAVRTDDGRAVLLYMIRGVNPNALNAKGEPALVMAVREESWKAVDSLLQYPALNLNARNAAGETALMMAALRGHLNWVKTLMARGAVNNPPVPDTPGTTEPTRQWTALHYAASAVDSAPCVDWLLKQGADPNARSPNGTTPLMMAARYGSDVSLDLLLKAGADKTLLNDKGLSAADFARASDRAFMIKRFP